MKTIVTILIGVLISTQVAFASVGPILCGTQGNCKNKGPVELSNDVIDLQTQIDTLNRKNFELENKINMMQKSVNQPTPIEVQGTNDQTQRIDNIEKRVGILENAIDGVKNSIKKTIDLLTKLLAKI